MESNCIKKHDTLSRIIVGLAALPLIVAGASGCKSEAPPPAPGETGLAVFSTAFQEGGSIPARYTCDGENTSPQIAWEEPPAGTKSLVLIMEDLDAPLGVFTHWVVYNIPPDSRELREGVPTDSRLEDGTLQGENSFKKTAYGGPCPPAGTHRYQFTVYALDTTLGLEAEVNKKQVIEAMEGHILARGMLTGSYGE